MSSPFRVMRTPRSVDIAITSHCNLRCSYCSHFTSAGDVSNDLPKDDWLQFFDELNRCRVMNVVLQGAEPFCRQDLKDILRGIVQNGMRFSILSNGTLVTDDMASFLENTGRCDTVQVSLDGSDPATHDSFRGKGNFLRAVEGINTLRRHRINVSVRVTIHRKNVGKLTEIAKFLLEDMGLPGFSTNSASFMGVCRHNAGHVQLTVEEQSFAMQALRRINIDYNGRISATAGPLAEAKAWLQMENARRQGRERIPGRGYLTGCSGSMKKLAVRADGAIVPCIQLAHMEVGRINQNPLQEVWLEHPQLNRLRERSSIPLNDFQFCKGCDYIDYCTGNCPALAYTAFGEENHPSPAGCLRRFLEAGGRLPEEKLAVPA